MDLGQVLRKVALEIYLDVKYMIEEMKKQDRELRTSVMKLFVARTKVKLTQLYLMTRWLSGRNVMDFFNRINDTGNQMQLINNGLALKLDEMFFSHSAVYSMRTEQLKLSRAADCLMQGGLRNLPASVFLIGSSSFPVDQVYQVTKSDLNLYIRSKLLVADSDLTVSSTNLSMTVSEGAIRIFKPHFFEIFLTLQQLSLNSKWNLLGIRILSRSVDHSSADPEPNFSHLEDALVTPCQRILAEQDGWHRVVELCHHAATGASLRLLHSSAVKAVSNIWKGYIAVDWKPEDECSKLVVQYWKSQFSKDYLFVLTIKQKRVISEDSAVLTSSLESKSIVYNVRNDKNTGLVTEFEEQFQTQQFIACGVDFDQLLKSCLSLCIQAKLQYLARRLTVSLSSANADKQAYDVVLGPNSIRFITTDRQPEVGVVIEVDARTGRYIIDSTVEAGCSLGEWKTSVELFVAEINNVQSEQLFGSYLTRYYASDVVINSTVLDALTPALSTLDVLLKYLEIGWWSHHLTVSLWKNGLANTSISTSSSSNSGGSDCGLLVEVTQWRNADAVRSQCAQNYHQVFLKGSKLPNLTVHSTVASKDNSVNAASKLTLGLFCDTAVATLKIVQPASLVTNSSLTLDAKNPTASCAHAVALLEQALKSCNGSGSTAEPVDLSVVSAGYLQHSGAMTIMLPHEQHLYLLFRTDAEATVGDTNHIDATMASNFHSIGAQNWPTGQSSCQLRLSCYNWSTLTCNSIVLEVFKLTDSCGSADWKSELFVQHLLHNSLKSFLTNASSSSVTDAKGLAALSLRWWNSVQLLIDVLLHLLVQPHRRTETVNYTICPVHHSEVGCGTSKVTLSVGVLHDIEAYFEIVLSNSQWGHAENQSTISVRNVISSASTVATCSGAEEAKQQLSCLFAELHVEE